MSALLWQVEFRSFASWDAHTPLLYIPVERTGVHADTEDDARREVHALAGPGGRIEILSVEKAAEWLQPIVKGGA